MKTRRGILAILTAGLLVAGTHAPEEDQEPDARRRPRRSSIMHVWTI